VRVFNKGDDEGGDLVQLSDRSGNTFTLDGALTITVGANTFIAAQDYNVVQASQKKHVFISDNGDPPTLSVANTTTFVYV